VIIVWPVAAMPGKFSDDRSLNRIYSALLETSDTLAVMNHRKRKNPPPLTELQTGQVWHMAESDLHVKQVGKRLVHYKLFRCGAKRTPTSLSTKRLVEEYLKENKAVLVQ
jgi:hypothetical protein